VRVLEISGKRFCAWLKNSAAIGVPETGHLWP
jgi:hypothetical protein